MSNLTITIDDGLLRAARVKAVQQGTSVNEVCRQAIAAFVSDDQAAAQARAHARASAFTQFCDSLAQDAPPIRGAASARGRARPNMTSRDDRMQGLLADKSPRARKP